DDAEAPLSDLLQELIAADDRSRPLAGRFDVDRSLQKTSGREMRAQQRIDPRPQFAVRSARPFEIGRAFGVRHLLQGAVENGFESGVFHSRVLTRTCAF